MNGGHVRKRQTKKGVTWQVVIELGEDEYGNRKRDYKKADSKKEADAILLRLLNDLESGTHIKEEKITLASYLQEWLKNYVEPNLSPTTQDGYRSNIDKYIIPTLGKIMLQKLTPLQIQSFYTKLLKEGRLDGKGGLHPKSIRYIHRNLREALEHAMRMQLINRNVADLITLPKITNPYQAEIYEQNELIELLEKIKGSDMEVPITISAFLGLRRGELLGLKWSDINLDEYKITIRNNLVATTKGAIFKTPKTKNSARTLELSETIVSLLKKHRKSQLENKLKLGGAYQDNDLVCCYNDGKLIYPAYFSRKFLKFLRNNGLKHIRLHDLRHSNATLMLKLGVPAKLASARLGHSSIAITLDLYSHVTPEMQKEVTDKLEEGFFSKVLGK